MNTCPITVLMPVYNGEEYLKEAIEGILNQSFANFEFLIINDCSTDRSVEIIQELSKKDSRIRLVHNDQNIGLTKSLNKGLEIARGEYIARQDADDISEKDRLERQYTYLKNNSDIVVVGGYISYVDSSNNVIGQWKMPVEPDMIAKGLMVGSCICHATAMFRKDIICDIGKYRDECKYTEDFDLWLRVSELYKMSNIPKCLYRVRRATNSVSSLNIDEQLNYHLLMIELAKERREIGSDSLKEINSDNIEETLLEKYKVNKFEMNKFKSKYIHKYYKYHLDSKEYLGALKFWWKSFFYEPERWKIKALIKDLLYIK